VLALLECVVCSCGVTVPMLVPDARLKLAKVMRRVFWAVRSILATRSGSVDLSIHCRCQRIISGTGRSAQLAYCWKLSESVQQGCRGARLETLSTIMGSSWFVVEAVLRDMAYGRKGGMQRLRRA
jgi:hypothetical protein